MSNFLPLIKTKKEEKRKKKNIYLEGEIPRERIENVKLNEFLPFIT